MTIYSDHQSRYTTPLGYVDAMISEYESIKEPSHGLRYIRDNSRLYSSFCDLIKHHIGLIMSRPKAIEDGHVTVYDKCLLELCRNGKYVDGLAGQEYFIREFMGIDPDSRMRRDVEDMIDRGVSVKDELLGSSRSRSQSEHRQIIKEEKNAIAVTQSQVAPSQNLPFSETIFAAYATVFHPDMTINTNINRMLHTYFRAKNDFYTRHESNHYQCDPERADAAKFLRDSAENALNYLEAQELLSTCDSDLVLELQTVFSFAKSKAIEILGGRKRRFEIESVYRDGGGNDNRDRNKVLLTDRYPYPMQRKRHSIDRYTGAYADHSWHPYARNEMSRSVRRHS
ncbi:hypothetical protein TMatcc_002787 [Talaromyces marneffei ATCC 18224]|uniref:Uncharacterized protein n=1 Tax=Talaromyces marneffei (strain ATCC 18224 / CBS 334.59 / QM 7333) TaxID=441960 RepID=B6Q8A8_TALMQ|nr:uncharacterized protein EYB26_002125 [Talaromyces marneffei]EEA28860.1 hypothetical protein PMAA_036510 [Talaromyces marneffei ATCC 18224]KAE8555531.1 hypothetical protein EYB25_000228 [Talaromyces marneffei]QGA14471.1 hypothetical protein EYB26_002125 [Talaromyces marneffei]